MPPSDASLLVDHVVELRLLAALSSVVICIATIKLVTFAAAAGKSLIGRIKPFFANTELNTENAR